VATFRKTRHENLILFMGACMKLPRLAIVTSLANGMTLYRHIHVLKDKFNMSRTTMVAQQISQVRCFYIVNSFIQTNKIYFFSVGYGVFTRERYYT